MTRRETHVTQKNERCAYAPTYGGLSLRFPDDSLEALFPRLYRQT